MFNDFQYYTMKWNGNLTEEEYNAVIIKANAYINQITHGRIENIDDNVKNAICAVCDVYHKREAYENGVVLSENLGGHSISYGRTTKTNNQWNAELYQTASLYIPEYLFRGGIALLRGCI